MFRMVLALPFGDWDAPRVYDCVRGDTVVLVWFKRSVGAGVLFGRGPLLLLL